MMNASDTVRNTSRADLFQTVQQTHADEPDTAVYNMTMSPTNRRGSHFDESEASSPIKAVRDASQDARNLKLKVMGGRKNSNELLSPSSHLPRVNKNY